MRGQWFRQDALGLTALERLQAGAGAWDPTRKVYSLLQS